MYVCMYVEEKKAPGKQRRNIVTILYEKIHRKIRNCYSDGNFSTWCVSVIKWFKILYELLHSNIYNIRSRENLICAVFILCKYNTILYMYVVTLKSVSTFGWYSKSWSDVSCQSFLFFLALTRFNAKLSRSNMFPTQKIYPPRCNKMILKSPLHVLVPFLLFLLNVK